MKMLLVLLTTLLVNICFADGLKSKNYEQSSTGTSTHNPSAKTPAMSQEQIKEVMKKLKSAEDNIKKRNKSLDDLANEK